MKKFCFVMMFIFLSIGICACGGSKSSVSESSKTQNDSTDKIDLGNSVIVDDETVTIKAVSFFNKDWKDYTDSCVCFEVTNKLNREIKFSIYEDSLYLGGKQVDTRGLDSSGHLQPGKTGEFNYIITEKSNGELIPVESLERLYELNGQLNVEVYSEDKSYIDANLDKEYTIDLSVLK